MFWDMSQRLQKVEVGNHIIAIYNNKEEKYDEVFEFLKNAINRNEVAMIITEELTKEEVIETMEKEFEINNIEELVTNGDFIIKSTSEWYSPEVFPVSKEQKHFGLNY